LLILLTAHPNSRLTGATQATRMGAQFFNEIKRHLREN
jgi:hypothetical protein